MAALPLAGSLVALGGTAYGRAAPGGGRAPAGGSAALWHTLAEVLEHLFPATPDGPGAYDLQALRYLQQALAAPDADPEQREFIFNGVGWLDDMARQNHQRPFVKLPPAEREAVLRRIEQSRAGERWLSTLLTYVIEALLADPVYGGNPEGIGWRWLEHQPGFPRPPARKRYFLLS